MHMKLLPCLLAAILLTGCAAQSSPALPPDNDPANIADYLYIDTREDYTFIAFRCPDGVHGAEWFTADGWNPVGCFSPDADYPAGSFVQITADVTILNGGEAGYSNEPQINTLKSVQLLDFAEAMSMLDIPSGDSTTGSYARKYQTGGGLYLIIADQYVYRDGILIGTYDYDGIASPLRALYDDPALLDYLQDAPAEPVPETAVMFSGGESKPVKSVSWASEMLYEALEQPENILDADAQPLSCTQIEAARENGFYLFFQVPDGAAAFIREEWVDYHWAAVCAEDAESELTAVLDGRFTVRLRKSAADKFQAEL